jgi:hypothetical protein
MFESEDGISPIAAEVKDGPTQKHPFGEEAQSETASLPITPDLFCCLYGPCKYYEQVGVVEREKATGMTGDQRRLCRRFSDDEGEIDLSEGNIDRCTSFQPPWWSFIGWRQSWIVACKLRAAHYLTTKEGSLTLRFRFWLALALGTVLRWEEPTLQFLECRDMDTED